MKTSTATIADPKLQRIQQWRDALKLANSIPASDQRKQTALRMAGKLAPKIARPQGGNNGKHELALYWRRFRSGNFQQLVVKSDTVIDSWNEGLIEFPDWFPEELIRRSVEDNFLWEAWLRNHQWVFSSDRSRNNYVLWARGPEAAGGEWSHWWDTAACAEWPEPVA